MFSTGWCFPRAQSSGVTRVSKVRAEPVATTSRCLGILSLSFRRVLGCALGLTAVDGCNVTRATMPPRGRGGSLHIQAEDIFSAFTLFDTNGDGVITRSEFVRILTRAGEGCTPLDEEQAIKLWNDFLQDVGAAHGHARAPSPFD